MFDYTSQNPDADALGSSMALSSFLTKLEKARRLFYQTHLRIT